MPFCRPANRREHSTARRIIDITVRSPRTKRASVFVLLLLWVVTLSASRAKAQSYGIELHNSMMPIAGAMAGTSLAMPQENLAALNQNVAGLSKFQGTQFVFSGGWAEGTYNITQLAPLPLVGVEPYSAKSNTPGSAIPNVGVTQDLRMFGLPATVGMGVITNAGAGASFVGVPESNGTSLYYLALDSVAGIGVDVTDRLNMGASFALGNSFLDGPFTDIGGMTSAYGVRGTIGLGYQLTQFSRAGFYWQTKKHFTFDDAVLFPGGTAQDVQFDHPENYGLGLANNQLMGGRLLLATDVIFKEYSEADFLKGIYKNQWLMQTGVQYTMDNGMAFRLGYGFNENPMRDGQAIEVGGIVLPDGIPALRYIQGQMAAVSQHRLTGGFGIRDVLPGLDMNMFAGGMFEGDDRLASTIASVESYWVGFGMVWRFGGNACSTADSCCTESADDFSSIP